VEVITIELPGKSCRIEIEHGLLSRLGERIMEVRKTEQVAVVTDANVDRRYGATVRRSLRLAGLKPLWIRLPAGERYKTLRTVERVYDRLVQARFERGSLLVALGGGVVGDLTGFVAATYLRGVDVIQAPTTLLAQVDASIGGKTAVDHPKGKNLIGAFHHPRCVVIDPNTLSTLPRRELISGMAEVIKYGVIYDAEFFGYLERNMKAVLNLEKEPVAHMLRKSCAAKAFVVQHDEREKDLRRILNYGHTLGHAIETATGYRRVTHGEAIAIGMMAAGRLGQSLGLCGPEVVLRQKNLLERAGLPTALPKMPMGGIVKAMQLDKKVKGGLVHFVLPEAIGRVVVRPVGWDLIKKALRPTGWG
jgi:3-dehydroquinate synthase